jgi:hypothetical protein
MSDRHIGEWQYSSAHSLPLHVGENKDRDKWGIDTSSVKQSCVIELLSMIVPLTRYIILRYVKLPSVSYAVFSSCETVGNVNV